MHTLDLWSLMHAGVAQAVHAVYLELVQNYPQLYERLYTLDEHTWRQILQSESGPPPAVLEVLELISQIAAEVGVRSPRPGNKYASDKMLFSLLYSSLPYDANSLAGNGVRARLRRDEVVLAAADPATRAGDPPFRTGRDRQHADDSGGDGFVSETAAQGSRRRWSAS